MSPAFIVALAFFMLALGCFLKMFGSGNFGDAMGWWIVMVCCSTASFCFLLVGLYPYILRLFA